MFLALIKILCGSLGSKHQLTNVSFIAGTSFSRRVKNCFVIHFCVKYFNRIVVVRKEYCGLWNILTKNCSKKNCVVL